MDTAGKSIGDRRPLLYLRLLTRRVSDPLAQICSHSSLIRRFGHSAQPPIAGFRMIDVHLPTTDGRELLLTRYTEPEPELSLLLDKLKLELPAQPPPKITAGPVPPIPL